MTHHKNSFLISIALLATGFTLASQKKISGKPAPINVPFCYVQTIKVLSPGNCTAPAMTISCGVVGKPVSTMSNTSSGTIECDDSGIIFCCAQLMSESPRQCFNQLPTGTLGLVDGSGSALASGYVKIAAVYCRN